MTFAASVNSSLQLAVEPAMRGRVMALYSVVFLGSTPIGGPLAGWLSEAYDPRVALLLAAISGLSAAWAARVCFAGGWKRTAKTTSADDVERQLVVELDRAEDVAAAGPSRRDQAGRALKRPSTISAATTIVTNISATIRSVNGQP